MILFEHDMTVRWACRSGDYVLWTSFGGLLSTPGNQYNPADVWALCDGNFVTITNRWPDFPNGFDLHPSEVCGRLVEWMMRRLDAGYEPDTPMDGPNLWRVRAGDRVVWVGDPRGGVDGDGPVLDLVTFNVDALVYGEPLDVFRGFGWFEDKGKARESERLIEEGWKAIHSLGTPRTVAADSQWALG